VLAQSAGYDGVEIMGSEGYLINEFMAAHTNQRDDEWGGRLCQPHPLPAGDRAAHPRAVGKDFIIIFRLSMLDLVPGGSTLGRGGATGPGVAQGGATILNTGIGWHEARMPTIATSVPRAAFAWVTQQLKSLQGGHHHPLVATNRINTPEVAEEVLASGQADMVSMARPLLADPEFVNKAAQGSGRPDINTCIACNQACLDHVFQNKIKLPGQPTRLPRDRAGVPPMPLSQERACGRGGRWPGGPDRRHSTWRARAWT
jgi:2,4-dienoyl-CoA reductase (NADPH2)